MIFKNLCVRNDNYHYDARNKHLIDVPYCRLDKTRESNILGPKSLNHVPKYVQELNKDELEKRLYDWLVLYPFYDIQEFFGIHSNMIQI